MTQPTPYDRQTSFALFSAENPGEQQSGVDLDTEFNAVKVSLDDTQSNLALLQADDGTLRAGTVGLTQFDESVTLGVKSKGVWVTAKAYTANTDTVFNTTKIYLCLVTHTSGVFATDLAAGKWLQIADLGVQVLDVNTVATTNLQDSSVSTAKIQDAAVTTAKLASGVATLAKLAAEVTNRLVPAGTVIAYSLSDEPAGWIRANGQGVDPVLYPTYWAALTALSNPYGLDGGGNPRTPNLMGRQIVGQDAIGGQVALGLVTTAGSAIDGLTLGAKGATQTKSLAVGNLPTFTPAGTIAAITPAGTVATTIVNQPAGGVITSEAGVQIGGGGTGGVRVLTATSAFTGTPVTPVFTGTPVGSATAFSTMDPSIVLPFLVKAH